MRLRQRLLSALLLVPLSAGAQDLASPESVLQVDNDLFVSNMGARPAPSMVDGDGYIARLTLDGTVQEPRFLPVDGTLNAPKGMAEIGGTLYVADIDRVVGFDLDSREQVFELSFGDTGTRFLNDLVAVDGGLLVSATDIDTIFEIDLGVAEYRPIMRFVRRPNGLYYDSERRRLYVAGYGRGGRSGELGVVRLDTRIPTYRRLGLRGRLDGIARVGDWLVISDWAGGRGDGRLHAYNVVNERVQRDVLTGLEGPADLTADAGSGRVWLPEMLGNRVRVKELDLAR